MPRLPKKNRIEIYDGDGKQINVDQHINKDTIETLTKRLALVYEELDSLGVLPTPDETDDIVSSLFTDMLQLDIDTLRVKG